MLAMLSCIVDKEGEAQNVISFMFQPLMPLKSMTLRPFCIFSWISYFKSNGGLCTEQFVLPLKMPSSSTSIGL
jgi:hypothetical protein